MNTDCILWDMDGVLADTSELHYQLWSTVLGQMGVPFSRDIFRPTFGMDNAACLTIWLGRPLTPEYVAEISDRKEQQFRHMARGCVEVLPGVSTLLQHFQSLGLRQAVASSAPRANIEALIEALDLRRYFDTLVSGEGQPGKPDPWVFLEAARRLNSSPDRCLVIEDSLVGVEAARRAGMRCLAVANTYPLDALQSADHAVERLDALPAAVLQSLLS
jgi:HAD superfamily hydrolase (TIGR01509 family)